MTGAYHTRDGGQHYRQLNFPGGAQSFAFDPVDDQIIYAGSVALYRSGDGGKSWKAVCPRSGQIVARQYAGDHAELSLKTSPGVAYWPPGQTIRAIRIDPADHRRIYFSVGALLFYSVDGGASWAKKEFAGVLEYVYCGVGSGLVLFSADSLFVLDRQMRVLAVRGYPDAMRPAAHFAAGAVKNGSGMVFYGLRHEEGGAAAVWVSRDGGRHWTAGSFPFGTSASAIACAEYDAANAYIVVDRMEERRPGGSAPVYYGVFRSSDAGRRWSWVWKGGGGSGQYGVPDAQNPANLRDGWAGKAFGREYIQLLDVGVDPHHGAIAVVTDWYRVMKTLDGGRTWTGVYSRTLPGDAAASTGLDVTTTYGVHFDPFDPKHIAVSCTDIGYQHSYDGGKSWIRSVAGVPADWVNTCYWVAFDPTVRNKCWGAWSGIHDLPRGKMTRDPQWKTKCRGGICVSDDGGRSWRPAVSGMGSDAPVTSVIVDPHSPPGNRILYAAVYNKGVFKSVDDGRSWTLHNGGIGENTCAFEISLAGNGDLYLVVSPTPDHSAANYSSSNRLACARFFPGAVYKSVDGAGSWQLLHPIAGDTVFPSGIGIDPLNPQRLYLACWSDITLGDLFGAVVRKSGGDRHIAMPGGIYRSEDGGRTWVSVLGGNEYVYDVTVDGHHPGRLYANTFTGKALRSDDYGYHWQKIPGYDFQWGHRVMVDENDTSGVYITTYGSGVDHLVGGRKLPSPVVR